MVFFSDAFGMCQECADKKLSLRGGIEAFKKEVERGLFMGCVGVMTFYTVQGLYTRATFYTIPVNTVK